MLGRYMFWEQEQVNDIWQYRNNHGAIYESFSNKTENKYLSNRKLLFIVALKMGGGICG
jgi:hypothetical protein